MELAVVYPVYNEVDLIKDTATRTIEFLRENIEDDFKVVFVTDGSTDGTQQEADRLAEDFDEVKHLEYDDRLGKGLAFEKAFENIDSEIFVYSDADLSTDLKHLEDIHGFLKENPIAIGSRRISSGFERGMFREIPSIFFNEMLRLSFMSEVKDHQCGFKGFRAQEVDGLFDEVDSDHWFWDAEMLVRAQRNNIDIKEFPVEWEEASDSKVSVFEDSMYFLKKIFELRVKLWKS